MDWRSISLAFTLEFSCFESASVLRIPAFLSETERATQDSNPDQAVLEAAVLPLHQ